MKKFLASIVFFVYDTNEDELNELLSKLDELENVKEIDVDLDDDGDWNIECDVYVDCDKEDDNAIHDILIGYLPDNTWDYHYIKGVDNNFYWQP